VLIDRALGGGFSHRAACEILRLAEGRAWRWRDRREQGLLEDLPSGGHPVHGLLVWEVTEILALFEDFGEIDRSHRKLAHRGSYERRVWVSPATVMRVLAAHGLVLKAPPRAGRSERRPFPEWATYTKNTIWIYDTSHFKGCRGVAALAIMDLVTRKWLTEVVSGEETTVQVQAAFLDALEQEGMLELVEARLDAEPAALFPLGDAVPEPPILLAVSDNGPQMTSGSTREFMAMCAIAQHFGRPGTPTDQAWIESLFGHIKAEWPHLEKIRDPAVLRSELARVREEYNTRRLHAGIGYVTPEDEHSGRGEKIRAARRRGMWLARRKRIDYHRTQRTQSQLPGLHDAD
jgi:putative transposase